MKLSSDLRPPGSFIILDEEDVKKLQEGEMLTTHVLNYEVVLITEEGLRKCDSYLEE